MKERIKLIIVLVIIIVLAYAIIYGISIGSFKILSISEIKNKNNVLNKKIEKASELTAQDYPNSIEQLEDAFEMYLVEKQRYEQLNGITSSEGKNLYESKKYDITYLWRVFGKYATTHNLTLTMNVEQVNLSEELYNLQFNVSGQYTNISEFIEYIEQNDNLYFRIYDFKISGSGEIITAMFKVKNIYIESSTITVSE